MAQAKRPNFLIIVADDLGFSDCGCFGSEISTPNIDALAAETNAVRFTNYHVAAACSPTRSMLMTGTDHHIAGFGQLQEITRASPAHHGQPGHEGYLNERVVALPQLLSSPPRSDKSNNNKDNDNDNDNDNDDDDGEQQQPYFTCMAGKWHLGIRPEHYPCARGFDRSFALLPGCANHYGWEPTYDEPGDGKEPGTFFETATRALHVEGDRVVDKLPDGFYSTDAYADKLIEYLEEERLRSDVEVEGKGGGGGGGEEAATGLDEGGHGKEDERSERKKKNKKNNNKERPFFAYLPFSAPHYPLQADRATQQRYRGRYDAGPAALRRERLARLERMGLVPPGTVPHPVVLTDLHSTTQEWSELPDDVRAASCRAMETYAAMVTAMDAAIGRVVTYLKQRDDGAGRLWDDTFVLFMSDNGAEGASYEAIPLVGEGVVAHLDKYYDNGLENIGRRDSFVWYGCRWAQAGTAPGRLYKMHSTEGGCRVPLIVRGPKGWVGGGEEGKVGGGGGEEGGGGLVSDAFCSVLDIVPTVLEMAGIRHPGTSWRGKEIAPLRGGRSWVDFLAGARASSSSSEVVVPADEEGRAQTQTQTQTQTQKKTVVTVTSKKIHPADHVMGFEIDGSGALRRGDWKICFVPKPRGPGRWELFDVGGGADPGETRDMSDAEPDLKRELLALWAEYKAEVGSVGVRTDYEQRAQGSARLVDEMEDPYAWIKYIGRPEITPERLKGVVTQV